MRALHTETAGVAAGFSGAQPDAGLIDFSGRGFRRAAASRSALAAASNPASQRLMSAAVGVTLGPFYRMERSSMSTSNPEPG